MEKKDRSVVIPEEVLKKVEKSIEKGYYKSISEFISESIRLRLQALAKENVLELQGQFFYTPKHIWARLTAEGNIQLGVSEYFCRKCKGITHFETVKVGENLSKGEPFAIVETPGWWFLHDLCTPVDGEVVKFNGEVINDPLILKEDHFKWIVEIQPNNLDFYNKLLYPELLSSDEYDDLTSRFENRQILPSNSQLDKVIKEVKRQDNYLLDYS